MKWFTKLKAKIKAFIKRETWWRRRYYRVEITPDVVHCKCMYCDAYDAPFEHSCNVGNPNLSDRECPCKKTQILIKK